MGGEKAALGMRREQQRRERPWSVGCSSFPRGFISRVVQSPSLRDQVRGEAWLRGLQGSGSRGGLEPESRFSMSHRADQAGDSQSGRSQAEATVHPGKVARGGLEPPQDGDRRGMGEVHRRAENEKPKGPAGRPRRVLKVRAEGDQQAGQDRRHPPETLAINAEGRNGVCDKNPGLSDRRE